ncbi:uncharacterized protein LOC127830958 [Dreissena polymorpha]|uniref:Uncharacterized protein n=1 Tax=Dreissena polymorpha TaxID=45954 RepID=A0A9D4JWP7_DREPO|nr:uncharacterized protein LOC127830958 [Dreissena polymorpha]KAH3827555.1 hypothetical protein DPMN_129492 [Dreissena polymorpha]
MTTSPFPNYWTLFVALCVLTMLGLCTSAPLDTFYSLEDTAALATPQRAQLLKDLREALAITEEKQYVKSFEDSDAENGIVRVLPQKRFSPFRTQTRGGGVALCLWKVCPAAPWLVARRR